MPTHEALKPYGLKYSLKEYWRIYSLLFSCRLAFRRYYIRKYMKRDYIETEIVLLLLYSPFAEEYI